MCREELIALKNDTDNKGLLMVSDFWNQVKNKGKWRIRKDLGHREDSPLKAHVDSLSRDLEERNILMSSLSDQLIWVRNTEGKFILKEAKRIFTGFNDQNPDQV